MRLGVVLGMGLVVATACSRTSSDFAPMPAQVVIGVVRSASGEPRRGAIVTAWCGGGCLAPAECGRAVTGDDGAYRLELDALMPEAHLQVGEASRGWRSGDARVDFVLGDASNRITGRVVDEHGAPVDAAHVTAEGLGTWTDADGGFLLEGLPPRAVSLEVTERAHAPLTTRVTAPASDVVLTMKKGATVRLTLTDGENCSPTPGGRELDAGVWELLLPEDRPSDLVLNCITVGSHDFFFVSERVGTPPPAELHIDVPATRQVRVELVDPHGKPVPNTGFMLRMKQTADVPPPPFSALEFDAAGTALLDLPPDTQWIELIDSPRVEHGWVASRREWHGESTLRFVWGPWPPPPPPRPREP